MSEGSENRPKCSVGVPVYNAEKFVAATLDVLLAQTLEDIEVVICDNASTDRTFDICRRYADRDSRVRLLQNTENLGAAENYNRVFRESRGQYFKWAAADDLIEPQFLENCSAALDQDDGAVLAYTKTTIIDQSGEPIKEHEEKVDVSGTDPVARYRSFMLTFEECNAVFGVIRSSVLAQTDLIRKFIGSDINLLAELCLYGRFVELPDRLFLRRDHPQASSADKSEAAQLEFFDPRLASDFSWASWLSYVDGWKTVWRAPLSARDRTRVLAFMARLAVWERQHLAGELRDYFRLRFRSLTASRPK